MAGRFLLAAAAGLAGICALAALLLPMHPRGGDVAPLLCPALSGRIATADRMEIAHDGKVFWLERRGSVWGVAEQGGYPARPGMAAALMDTLQDIRLPAPAQAAPMPASPFEPGAESGTTMRVLAVSGATLCALVAPARPAAVLWRPGEAQAWTTTATLDVAGSVAAWEQQTLPPLDPAQIRSVDAGDGADAAAVRAALTALPVAAISPAALHHPAPLRSFAMVLDTGTAILTVGTEDGRAWLRVTGTAPWAQRLSPYAFALPEDSPLLAPS